MILKQQQSEITKLLRASLPKMCLIEMLICLLIWVGEKVTRNLFSIPYKEIFFFPLIMISLSVHIHIHFKMWNGIFLKKGN